MKRPAKRPKPKKRAAVKDQSVRSKSEPPLDPLALVRAAEPVRNTTAPPAVSISDRRFFAIAATPIPGVSDDELAAILEREGIRAEYQVWGDAKLAAMALSVVGGIESAVVVSDLTKRRVTRGEMWINGRCVSLDGGVTKTRRED